jgi:hypothetical protein
MIYRLPERTKRESFLRILNGALMEGVEYSIVDDVVPEMAVPRKVEPALLEGTIKLSADDFNSEGMRLHFASDEDMILFVAKYV